MHIRIFNIPIGDTGSFQQNSTKRKEKLIIFVINSEHKNLNIIE